MTRTPDFDELVGAEGAPEELERLRRVHDLLVRVGPPPELPTSLAEAPERPGGEVRFFPRRRLGAALVLAAAVLLAAFGVGYFAGDRGNETTSFDVARTVTLRGTAQAPDAIGVVRLGRGDANGNWPMLVTIEGLKRVSDGYYTLALTREGEPVVVCGSFNVSSGREPTTVRLSAAYRVTGFDGWVVVEYKRDRETAPIVLRTAKI